MTDFLKRLFKLNLSAEEQHVLNALNTSSASKRVIGRGTLTVKASDITSSDKFRTYTEKASVIVSYQNN
ncbi:MAG: hypothetical protein ACTH4U_02165 [Pseudoalteromonas prydzensis]|uniref:hypothetical protein n=1 Tax=Pseudoalteromonas prydzensis TaxID=182141 RepID=UPI0024BC3DA8|nr:hypothetical protein [Pseudoalteromonas prydzensis]